MAKESDFVVIHTVQGELQASVVKSHLEHEGIPVLLQYESAGRVFGLTVDGLGEVKILVPGEYAEDARRIIEPRDIDQNEWKEQ
jgi:hypothetical protein